MQNRQSRRLPGLIVALLGSSAAAAAATVSSTTDGKTCGGSTSSVLSSLQCPGGSFCLFKPYGDCGGTLLRSSTGLCTVVPEVCPALYQPVCGCDGKTYPSDCMAYAASVSVKSEGVCPGSGDAGAGLVPADTGNVTIPCSSSSECVGPSVPWPAVFCRFQDATTATGDACPPKPSSSSVVSSSSQAGGRCAMRPDVCAEVYQPVCGCDGVTYANLCAAHMAGVSAAGQPGPCKEDHAPAQPDAATLPSPSTTTDTTTEPARCGGLMGLACPKGNSSVSYYCDFEPGAHCGAADQMGVCRVRPMGCNKMLMPVCGCDGKTYSNSCMAASAGVAVAAQGECSPASSSSTKNSGASSSSSPRVGAEADGGSAGTAVHSGGPSSNRRHPARGWAAAATLGLLLGLGLCTA